jgi:hypothetical protein
MNASSRDFSQVQIAIAGAAVCGPDGKDRAFPIDQSMALWAADLSSEFSLPMAHAFVLSAARALGAELITCDTDFKNIPGVRVLRATAMGTALSPDQNM